MIKISRIVHAARAYFGLDIAFVSQFLDKERVFRHVDVAPHCTSRLSEGQISPLHGSYCSLLAEGKLPNIIPDTSLNAIASGLPVTHELRIGAHIGVPVRLSDGTVFGTFCCFSTAAQPSLRDDDLAALRAFAELAAAGIEQDLLFEQSTLRKEQRVKAAIADLGPAIVYQPVFTLDGLRPVGAEALSRFPSHSDIPVDVWFKDAADLGLQVELELSALTNAISHYRPIWARHRVQLGLNVSPATLLDERLWRLLEDCPRELMVLELTEHEEVRDYPALLEATTRLRAHGTKIAIDDVGAGYASMRHVLQLRPDILKLDLALTRSIDTDELKFALAASLKHFADRFNCKVLAEGVETPAELETLQKLGLQAVQGFLLGRPGSPDELSALLDRAGQPAAAVSRRRNPGARRAARLPTLAGSGALAV